MDERKHSPFRVGVIGLGLMGRRMLGSLTPHSQFQVAAGFDLDGAAMQACAEQFGFEPACDAQALLARSDLDLIYVATPPASHVELARRVIESGRPLFLEKPLSVDLRGAQELVELVEASRLPAALNFPLATLPGLRRIERELADGTAGRPLRLEVTLHFSQWPRTWHVAGEWLAGDSEGGFLREVFSHFAYFTQRLLGPQRVLHANVTRAPGQGETRVLADLLAGDVPVSLVGGAGGAAPDFNGWTLFCETRSYRLQDWAELSFSDGAAWQPLEGDSNESRGAETQLDELAALLRGEPSSLPDLRAGLDVMRVVEGLLAQA
ncbi:MAG: putative dehydrogenase [Candidatus Paceibacteria bacterium]|jgi:predicted dehydrogenase